MASLSQDRLLRWLGRLYALTLWAYPSDFRRAYGREMTLAFHNRAREIACSKGAAALAPFIAHITWDWIHSAVTEHNSMRSRMALLRWIAALPLAMVAAYGAMRAAGFAIGFFVQANFQHVWIFASVGFFSMAAAFVAVGALVAPDRRDAVARIAVTVVGSFGVYAIAVGAFYRAFEPVSWGACMLLGGLAAYFPWRFRSPSRAGHHVS